MIGIYVAAILVCLASLLVGGALFALVGRDDWTWLEGGVGLAALIVISHVAISLPGGAIVAVIILALLLIGAAIVVWRGRMAAPPAAVAVAVAIVVLLAAAIPFALNERIGVLGEGVYSNDHAVHLYWADWLQNEVGPKPKGIGWGYPVGPHALVAAIAEATGITVESVFNGLMLAISALTALTALGALRRLPAVPRVVAATLVGLPFLAVSFLVQSSFKEMAIALFVLCFALSLSALSREGPEAGDASGAHPGRALVVGIGLLAVASVLTFSVPGLAWFAAGIAVWLVVELIAGRLPFSPRAALARLRRAWPVLAAAAVALILVAIVEAGTISRFADRIGEVQESQGRLPGRLPPWEVLGVWPRGDFRVATSAVDGAVFAILFGLLAAAVAAVWWLRRRQLAVPAVLAAAFAIFLVARFTSGIHVEAKALIAASPLVMLFILRGLLEGDRRPGDPRPLRARTMLRLALGALFAGAAVLSTFLALRAAPVGTHAHPDELAELRSRVAGKEVAFLSLDRFAPYRLRGAERVQSPGGYVPNALRARKGKRWEQSQAVDFDTLESDVLDRFGYAVTTGAIYGSSAPENWSVVDRTTNFVLWKRNGRDRPRKVLDEDSEPGTTAESESPACDIDPRAAAGKDGSAGFWPAEPILADHDPWRPEPEFDAGESARLELLLPEGAWQLSLQYNSEVPLTLRATGGLRRTLPAALDGMYGNSPGKGSFWPAGELITDGGTVEVEVTAEDAPALSRLVGAKRRAWLGDLAAVRVQRRLREPHGPPSAESGPLVTAPLTTGCGRYLDWYILER